MKSWILCLYREKKIKEKKEKRKKRKKKKKEDYRKRKSLCFSP